MVLAIRVLAVLTLAIALGRSLLFERLRGTWIAILVLGPGSVIVFLLFLRDIRKILGETDRNGGNSDQP